MTLIKETLLKMENNKTTHAFIVRGGPDHARSVSSKSSYCGHENNVLVRNF